MACLLKLQVDSSSSKFQKPSLRTPCHLHLRTFLQNSNPIFSSFLKKHYSWLGGWLSVYLGDSSCCWDKRLNKSSSMKGFLCLTVGKQSSSWGGSLCSRNLKLLWHGHCIQKQEAMHDAVQVLGSGACPIFTSTASPPLQYTKMIPSQAFPGTNLI